MPTELLAHKRYLFLNGLLSTRPAGQLYANELADGKCLYLNKRLARNSIFNIRYLSKYCHIILK